MLEYLQGQPTTLWLWDPGSMSSILIAFPPDTCHNPALILPWVREFRGDSHFLPANNFTDAVRVCAASLVALPKWQLGMAVLAECLSTQLRDYVRVVGLGYSGKGDNHSHYQSEVI